MLQLYIDKNTDDIQKISDSEYRNIPVISQGLLKDMDNDPSTLIENKLKKKTKYLDKGSVLDLIILNHNSFNNVEDVINKLSDKILLNIMDLKIPDYSTKLFEVLNYIVCNELKLNDENILKACNFADYYPNYTNEKKISLINENSKAIDFMNAAFNKTITTLDDISLAINAKSSFNSFMNNKISNYKNSTKLYQFYVLEKISLPEFYSKEDFFGKGAIDNIIIDEENGIIHVVDLKTGNNLNFYESFFNFKYYYQIPFYTMLLKEYFRRNNVYSNYEYKLHYVYINTKNYIPVLYTLTNNAINNVMNGGTIKGKQIKGLFDLLNEYYFYLTEQKFDMPKIIYDNQFEFSIDE